jgi:excisionase family DNA binding protein
VSIEDLTKNLVNYSIISKNFEELPMYMSVPAMAKLLGISESSGYELVHEKGFPAFRIGTRIVIERDKLRAWLDKRMRGGVVS